MRFRHAHGTGLSLLRRSREYYRTGAPNTPILLIAMKEDRSIVLEHGVNCTARVELLAR